MFIRSSNMMVIPFDFEKKIEWAIHKAKREVLQPKDKVEEEMANLSHQTIEDYCRRTNDIQISLGFQSANPLTFDIKNYVVSGLRENPFDGKAIRDPWENLDKFYETFCCAIPIM